MGELLYSAAPFHQNVRKHATNVGEILSTSISCVARNPEKNGNEDKVKFLGNIDTVNFELGSKNEETSALKTSRDRSTASSGCYGDNINEGRAEKKKIKRKAKTRAERLPSSEVKTAPQILVTGSPQNYEKKVAEKTAKIESSKLSVKKNFVKNVAPVGKQGTRTMNRYHTAPSRSKILPLKQKAAKKTKSSYKKESGKSSQVIKNVTFRERPLYHTFPGGHGTISQGKSRNESQEENTSFLEMLKTSEVGIYESKMMKVNASSVWVEKILRQGVKEEQLLPRINPRVTSERKSGDGSELESTDKITQTPNATATGILPRVSFNGKVEVRGGESVLIIEHEHEKIKEKDKVLYRVGFALEGQVKTSRNFPKVSIIEIADSLGEFVEMGVIKVIQRRNKRWLILVEGKVTKDFLLQNGVVLGGRHFELIELKTF